MVFPMTILILWALLHTGLKDDRVITPWYEIPSLLSYITDLSDELLAALQC
jgi:hypothetical protein